MATTFNALGSQTITGTNLQDRFYAFTYDDDLNHVRADATIVSFSWTTSIRTSATTFFTITGNNVQTSSDFYAGGEKNDFIYGSNLNDAILYNNGVISGGVGSFSSIEQIELGAGDDIIDLSAHGAGGVDYGKNIIIHGDDGNDIIIGGAGMDTLYGDGGDDLIFGYRGADTIYGGAGNDTLYGDDLGFNGIAGDDFIYGQAGNDILYGGARTDRLEGGDGDDTLYGGAGGDNLLGGSGNDILFGDEAGVSGNDKLDGESGNDQLFGGAGNDEVLGGAGNDLIEGGDGEDFLGGSEGADILVGGGGDDFINGGFELDFGPENDTAVYSGNRSDYSISYGYGKFTIKDLRAGSPDGWDSVQGVEFFQFADGTFSAASLSNPPVITSNGGGTSVSLSVHENQTAVTDVNAMDPDHGEVIAYSISGGTDAALFTIDPNTGVLTFITPPNFEAPGDADGDNIYEVVVRATDFYGAFDQQSLLISVTDVGEGSPPVITSNGGGVTAAVSISENSTVVTTVEASDAEGTAPTYSIAGGVDAALFSIDPLTGALAFIHAPDYEAPADANGDNIYDVVVQASDGTNADLQQIAITVGNVNDASPVISSNGGGSTAATTVIENSVAVSTVAATDPDSATLIYSIVGGADAGFFSIDPSTGELIFTSAQDFETPADFNSDNVYDVVVQASDGTNTDQQQIAVTVSNSNDNAPVITSNGGGGAATVSIAENSLAVTVATASDLDGSTITYSIVGGADAALFSINPLTGALVFNNAPDFENPADAGLNNIYDVIVRASDGVAFDDQTLSVTVTDVNEGGKTITGSSGNNTISPTATNTAYQTTALNDTIYALAGNDIIDGGAGADRMEGGTGNDTYYVDQFSDDGNTSNDDLVIELAGAGTDIVNSSVTYSLTANVENLSLIGGAAINGTGNELDNVIVGNAVANILSGGLGNDTLTGGDGNDTLIGGAGADRLDGGLGADIMQGGADNDTYFVDVFNYISPPDGDQVIEAAGGGVDTVNSSVYYILPDEVENLTIVGPDAIDGTGNSLANVITGNDRSNFLYGLDGDDTINGAGGDDNLQGGNGNDTLNGGTGNDDLNGDAGADKLSGGDGDDFLFGSFGNDTLNGQAGNDRIWGGAQKDSLTGGAGSDVFEFGVNDSSLSSSSYDIITDFVTGVDKIDVPAAQFGLAASAYAEGAIASNLFSDAMASAQSMFTAGKSVAFVAGTTDGWLFWDQNGDGVIDQSILLKGLNSVGAMDYTDII